MLKEISIQSQSIASLLTLAEINTFNFIHSHFLVSSTPSSKEVLKIRHNRGEKKTTGHSASVQFKNRAILAVYGLICYLLLPLLFPKSAPHEEIRE